VAGLGRTRLAKSVHDAGWSAFTAMLAYKARKHGRTFGRTGRWEPTSQVCSACGVTGGPSRSASASGRARRAVRCMTGM
jgi:putative transposase